MNGSQPAPARGDSPIAGSGDVISYDDQASRFEERVGLPEQAVSAVRAAILKESAGGLAVEIGAGTGRLGAALLAAGVRYLGIDNSAAMLAQFRARLPAGADPAVLIQADGNRTWPLDDRAAQVVFGLRSIHHLAVDHACDEALRVLRPGGVLLIGRVERGPGSLHTDMRQRMHQLVRERGFAPLKAGRAAAALIERLSARGAEALPPRTLATWTVAKSPARLIADWQSKRGLGGLSLPAAAKRAILGDLSDWAANRFADADAPQHWEESLVWTGARLHPRETAS